LNHRAFKLSKHAHHLKQRLARWRRRVQALLVQVEIDANRMDFVQEADQVLQ
jgi:FtsZ-binding cell division protein ZapB